MVLYCAGAYKSQAGRQKKDHCVLCFLPWKENNVSLRSKQRCWSRWADRYAERQVVTQTGSYTSQQMQAARQTDLQIRRSQTDEGNECFCAAGVLLNSWSGIHGNMDLAFLENAGESSECRRGADSEWGQDPHETERDSGVHPGHILVVIFYHGSDCQQEAAGCRCGLDSNWKTLHHCFDLDSSSLSSENQNIFQVGGGGVGGLSRHKTSPVRDW